MKGIKIFLGLLLLFGWMVPAPVVVAQSSYSIRVNFIETTEGDDALDLRAYFTVYDDATGKAVSDSKIESAEFVLVEDNTRYPASVSEASTPFYIALVLDASGSMTTIEKDMKKAAIQALNNPPPGAQFAVFQFNEELKMLHDFSSNMNVVTNSIQEVTVENLKGTCLYDAAYDTIDMLSRMPEGRRALVLFTDGRDELLDGSKCSRHSYDEIIIFSNDSRTRAPINTIGLSGNASRINATELQNIASTTGGFSAIGSQGDIGVLFQEIMTALGSQWEARANLYPAQGKHSAILQVVFKDGTPISTTIPFESSKMYMEPFSLSFDGFKHRPAENTYQFDLKLTSPQKAGNLYISVWDKNNGVEALNINQTEIQADMQLEFSADSLESGRSYEMRISIFDPQGNKMEPPTEDGYFVVHAFRYDKTESETQVNIGSIEVIQNASALRFQVESMNGDSIETYKAWLENQDTNIKVDGTDYSLQTPLNAQGFVLPLQDLAAGTYRIVLTALDDEGNVLSKTASEGLVYTPPAKPSAIQRLGQGLAARPIFIIFIIIIILAVIVWLMLTGKSAKKVTGTPVLQGSGDLEASLQNDLPVQQTIAIDLQETQKAKAGPVFDRTEQVEASGLKQRKNALLNPPLMIRVVQTPNNAINNQTCLIQKSPFMLGRGNCDLALVGDKKVSREHARITFDDRINKYYIEDLQSNNGTWINGQRLNLQQKHELTSGTLIGLGPLTRLIVEIQTIS